MDGGTELGPIDELCKRIHLELQEGRLVAQDVVELACCLLDCGYTGPAVVEVMELRPTDVSAQEMDALAGRLLETVGFDPGFTPARLETLHRALRIAARDLPAACVPDAARLVVDPDTFPECAAVELNGGWIHGAEIEASAGDNLAAALVTVADHLQESVMERYRRVWPVCGIHRLGPHPIPLGDTTVWQCAGGGGHVLAPVGELPPGAGGMPGAAPASTGSASPSTAPARVLGSTPPRM